MGAEATTVLVGAVDFVEQPTIAFVRLAEGIFMPSITEVSVGYDAFRMSTAPSKGLQSQHSENFNIWYFLHLPITSVKVISSILTNSLICFGCNKTHKSCPVCISIFKNLLNCILCQIRLKFRVKSS